MEHSKERSEPPWVSPQCLQPLIQTPQSGPSCTGCTPISRSLRASQSRSQSAPESARRRAKGHERHLWCGWWRRDCDRSATGSNSYATASFIITVISVCCTARRAPVMDAGFSVCLRGDKESRARRCMLQPPPPPPPVGRSDRRLLSTSLLLSVSLSPSSLHFLWSFPAPPGTKRRSAPLTRTAVQPGTTPEHERGRLQNKSSQIWLRAKGRSSG